MTSLRDGKPVRRGDGCDDPRRRQHVRVRLLAPEREQRSEVGERVAERAHLPVEDRDDPAGPRGMQDGVVEPVVAVHDRVLTLLGEPSAQFVAQRVERGQVLHPRRLPLLGPATQLAFHEAGGPAELRQADARRVEAVQVRENVDEDLADGLPVVAVLGVARRKLIAADMADDALHDVERRPERALGIAEVQHPRNRDGRPLERREDPVLADHVMGRGKDVTERRTPQDDLAGVGGDPVRQVRLAAGDERHVAGEPAFVVQHLREQRPDDPWVGPGADALQALGRGVVEARLGCAAHLLAFRQLTAVGTGWSSRRCVARCASIRPSSRSW